MLRHNALSPRKNKRIIDKKKGRDRGKGGEHAYDLEIGIALQTEGEGRYQDEFASRFSAQRLEAMRT